MPAAGTGRPHIAGAARQAYMICAAAARVAERRPIFGVPDVARPTVDTYTSTVTFAANVHQVAA